MSLYDSIVQFLRVHEAAPRQKSPEWYDMRSLYVGGSEIGPLLGEGRHHYYIDDSDAAASKWRGNLAEIDRLVEKKNGLLNIQQWPGLLTVADDRKSLPVVWGTLMEDICVDVFERTYACDVVGRDVTIVTPYGLMCSPDGYCVARVDETTGKPDANTDPKRYLVEFKAPITRAVRYDGRIPSDQYAAQVQCGLALSADIVDRGLFVEMQFLLCSLDTLYLEGRYNKAIHSGLSVVIGPAAVSHVIVLLETRSGRTGDLGVERSRESLARALDGARVVNIIYGDGPPILDDTAYAILPLKLVGAHTVVCTPVPRMEELMKAVMNRFTHVRNAITNR